VLIFQEAVVKEWVEIEETVFRSAGDNYYMNPEENKSKDGLLRRIDRNTLDVVGATEDVTKSSNEFFKKRPTTKKNCKKNCYCNYSCCTGRCGCWTPYYVWC